ncbi:L-amino acid N-acyltransferase YncA [Thermoflavifilum aggregans]|uniref:L-amino acid N-acyltransferase YncA n=1 Tax=Thermoflavifilum aggregans TaxID=454188 RepID=A0A2M9CTF7_9BACT|nr:GNAT family N-acetyltransferase [Thermoflavifilum aggregans]MBX6379737.1 GNAT family N-acetyltransferase [Thermoflavifilum aggregans]PJJ75169.1 L-amino acid N-acyltransferase YncA [Thermoflavifilum aggregans]
MSVTIRRAGKADCPQMLALVQELAAFERAPHEVTITLEHFTESGFGPNPIWWAFVAEDDSGRIVGMALYYIRFSTWKGQRLYLEDIIVTQDMRGRGIGKQLFERCIQEAKAKGFSGMTWQVLDWNEPAIRFYEKYGARISREWLTCQLDW